SPAYSMATSRLNCAQVRPYGRSASSKTVVTTRLSTRTLRPKHSFKSRAAAAFDRRVAGFAISKLYLQPSAGFVKPGTTPGAPPRRLNVRRSAHATVTPHLEGSKGRGAPDGCARARRGLRKYVFALVYGCRYAPMRPHWLEGVRRRSSQIGPP